MYIKDNPFYLLEISPYDNKRRIMDAAEEKLLFIDSDAVENAKAVILDSDKRLDAELSWFSSILPEDNIFAIEAVNREFHETELVKRIAGYDEIIYQLEVIKRRSFSTLKNENAFGMAVIGLTNKFEEYAEWNSDAFLALQWLINNSREIAGFPMISDENLLNHLDKRRDEIVLELVNIMKVLQPDYLISSMSFVANRATNEAKRRAPMLIESLLESYEIEIQPFVLKQEEKIYKVYENVLDEEFDESITRKKLAELIEKIGGYFGIWHKVTKPVQIISLSKGTEHKNSRQLLSAARSVGIKINNDFDMPELSLRLIDGLRSFGAWDYIPSLWCNFNDDINVLRKIIKEHREYERQQQEEEREYNEWVKSIRYETEIGIIFKDKFRISENGIEWNNCITPLYGIKGISWGATRKYINGIPTGTDYTIAYQTENGKVQFSPNRSNYEIIIERLWRALAVPIFTTILKKIQNGETIIIGRIEFNDEGVFLEKSGFFTSYEKKFFPWSRQINVYSEDGSCIVSEQNRKYSASASYIYDMNTHIFEFIVRQFLKSCNSNSSRLSILLKNHR